MGMDKKRNVDVIYVLAPLSHSRFDAAPSSKAATSSLTTSNSPLQKGNEHSDLSNKKMKEWDGMIRFWLL